ncbi:MAG: pyridoxamine 5'-phosphate oxidase family protein [Pseudomonadota bacterium]
MPLGSKLNGSLRAFIARQPMFFVATAAATGRVNLSPKGADSLRILSDSRVRWLNLSGSGNETAGHLRQLNRMTLMFCAFDGDPMILRLYGTADTLHPQDAGWAAAAADFPPMAGSRQIFDMTIEAVQTSCGSGVPEMSLKAPRAETDLIPHFDRMGRDGLTAYWQRKNARTIDGFETGILADRVTE